MYKIGDFSSLSKTTIKTIRYYEQEELLKPCYIDKDTNYRYYDASQLIDLSKIISLRQIGISIKDIKKILDGNDMNKILNDKKKEIEKDLITYNTCLSKINYLLEEKNMKNEVIIKDIPSYIVYYRDSIIKDFSEIGDFVVETGELCRDANPTLKCITPDYCYVSYLDGEYKENNIKVRYAQAVSDMGNETDEIKFIKINPVTVASLYHKGSYDKLRNSYNVIMKYIENNGYQVIDNVRECYIDGCWNKDNEDDYLTEIQFPIIKK